MKRQVRLEEISDGKFYDKNDMAKLGCGDCAGCSACCKGVGNTIILDPYDVFLLCAGTGRSFEALLQSGALELNMVDGTILPNLRMTGPEETCTFLNEEGRCGIHAYRPGICRLFPLGRYYENGQFRYILQVNECKKGNRTKVKVQKWLDTPNLARYEQYITDWHYFAESVQNFVKKAQTTPSGETCAKQANLSLLKLFYLTPYQMDADFYAQFEARLKEGKDALSYLSSAISVHTV